MDEDEDDDDMDDDDDEPAGLFESDDDEGDADDMDENSDEAISDPEDEDDAGPAKKGAKPVSNKEFQRKLKSTSSTYTIVCIAIRSFAISI